jgi:hypothetical protein
VAIEIVITWDAAPSRLGWFPPDILGADPPSVGQAVRASRVQSRWIGVPVSPSSHYLADADGLIKRIHRSKRRAEVELFSPDTSVRTRLTLAGCDHAAGLLSRAVEQMTGIEIVITGSSQCGLKAEYAWRPIQPALAPASPFQKREIFLVAGL